MKTKNIKKQIQLSTIFFMVALAISGLTAIPAKQGIVWLLSVVPDSWAIIHDFLDTVRAALISCHEILLYGYDWLAFAHLVIAVLFWGVLKNPVRNIWVVEFGMIACILIFPFAFLMGTIRGIPIWWQLIDCSFGLVGLVPLWYVHRKIKELEKLQDQVRSNFIF